jgi:hypothetical protein
LESAATSPLGRQLSPSRPRDVEVVYQSSSAPAQMQPVASAESADDYPVELGMTGLEFGF